MAELLTKHEIQENMNELSSLWKVKDIYLIEKKYLKNEINSFPFSHSS